MRPTLTIPIAGWTWPAYETLYGFAILGAALLGPVVIGRVAGLPRARVRLVVVGLILSAFVGARAFFVVTHWSEFTQAPLEVVAAWRGGRNATAALATLLAVAPLVARMAGLPAARFCDAGVPVVALTLAVARIGCFLHGCCGGAIASCPWCVAFPAGSAPYRVQMAQQLLPAGASRSFPTHPLQLYFAATGLAIALLAVPWNRHKRFDGEVTLGSALLFASTSAGLEWFRSEHPGRVRWWGVPALAWAAVVLAAVSAMALWLRWRSYVRTTVRTPRSPPAGPEEPSAASRVPAP